MNATEHITTIHDLLETWRGLGQCTLRTGVELIGRMPVDDESVWMHAVFPGCSVERLAAIEHAVGATLPRSLRAFLRCCGGMNLFFGAFRLGAHAGIGRSAAGSGLQPLDLVALNHELDVFGWRPRQAIAFAENGWDLSVHLVGMTPDEDRVVRCDRQTGAVMEEHADVFACVAERLSRLDQLLLR